MGLNNFFEWFNWLNLWDLWNSCSDISLDTSSGENISEESRKKFAEHFNPLSQEFPPQKETWSGQKLCDLSKIYNNSICKSFMDSMFPS